MVDYSKYLSLFQALVFPQTKLPDDVVAPVLSPFPRRTSFELPKMPIEAKLSNSGGMDNSPHVRFSHSKFPSGTYFIKCI